MRGIRSVSVCMAVFAALLLIGSTPASATVYSVDSSDYTRTVILSNASIMDNFELTAKSGEHIKYSVSVNTPGGCALLFFSKGHDITMQSQYLVAYSQENCVQSYSNEFPVSSDDGTDFTVTISTSYPDDLDYTVTIKTFAPAIPDWLVGVLVFIVIIVIVAVIGAVVRGRKRKAAQAQMMPPMQPPQQPPFPPQ